MNELLPKLYSNYPARAYCINDTGIVGGESANQFSGSTWDGDVDLAAFLHDLQPEVTIDVAAAFGS